jgi:hypothetical protein
MIYVGQWADATARPAAFAAASSGWVAWRWCRAASFVKKIVELGEAEIPPSQIRDINVPSVNGKAAGLCRRDNRANALRFRPPAVL